jgi:CheY-like chemotaxis protein
MEKGRSGAVVLILENRQTIAMILADLLEGAGYDTEVVSEIIDAQEVLPRVLPALFLADLGMVRPEHQVYWQSLESTAASLNIPLLLFACSPLPGVKDLLVLRSPADFAMVVETVQRKVRLKPPLLGMTMVDLELISTKELNAVLDIQKCLAQIGRYYSLGDLCVRLDLISPEELQRALREQES